MKLQIAFVLIGLALRSVDAVASPACSSFDECVERCEAADAAACDLIRTRFAAACDANKAAACALLGDLYDTGDLSTPKSPETSFKYLRRACELGHGGSCNNWGFALVYGQGVARDDAKGVAAWKRGCELDHPLSCGNYGARLRHGRGIARDDKLAGEVLGKACRLDDAVGCHQLGVWHEDHGRRKDAIVAWMKACASRHDDACGALTTRGESLPAGAPTPAESHVRHLKGCDANQPIECSKVADDYRYGRGVKSNEATADAFEVRACVASYPLSCERMGRKHAERGDLVEADRYYVKACDLGLYSSCAEAGFLRRTLGTAENGRTPLQLFDVGCKANNAESCFGLGGELETGKGTRPNVAKALVAYERACDGRHGQACAAAARLSHGAKAARARSKACQLGVKSSCATAPGTTKPK